MFSELLHKHPKTAAEIAEEVSRVLRRTVEARIYHWLETAGRYPPPYAEARCRSP